MVARSPVCVRFLCAISEYCDIAQVCTNPPSKYRREVGLTERICIGPTR